MLALTVGASAQDAAASDAVQPAPVPPVVESSVPPVEALETSGAVAEPAASIPVVELIETSGTVTNPIVPTPEVSAGSTTGVTSGTAAAPANPVPFVPPAPQVSTSSTPGATLAAPGATPKRMLNVAVLPFTGNSAVNAEELNAITSRFESELMAQGTFRVLERRNVDAILREQGFQQSGACNTSDCQVEVGQMLGVERIVTGEVTRMEKLWSLNLRMVDVGTGAVASSHVLDIKGKLETVLRGGCPEMAEIIAGKKQPGNSRTVLAEEKKGISPWVWVAGGTVLVGGGVAAALLLTQDDGGGATAESAPPRDITVTLETGR